MCLKKPLDFEEQLQRLKEHGMSVQDDEKALVVLKRINYYRFTGYALQFRENPQSSKYIKETSFEAIYHLNRFDEKLRDLYRKYIEKAEIFYRTQISYGFTSMKCTKVPFDQHYNIKNFYNKKGYQEVMDNFRREENYYKDSLIVKHHKNKYKGKMPLWGNG